MDGDNNKRVEGAETLLESAACSSGRFLKAAEKSGMYFLLVLVLTAHGRIEEKDSKHLLKIEEEFHDFESDIVDEKDEATMRGMGGKGLKEFWCDLYKYR